MSSFWNKYKTFLTIMLPLAIPIIIQNTLTTSLGMLDGIMLSHVGDKLQGTLNMAAVSQANRTFFVIMLFYFGISAGASIFFSQFFGKKDIAGLRRILGVAITIGLLFSMIPFFISLFFAREVISLFVSSGEKEIIDLGTEFLKIIGWSYPIYILTWIYGYALRSIGFPKVFMMASIISLLSNAIMNFFFIYGFGTLIPAMGVKGAAWGTTISRFIEFCIVIGYIYTRRENPLKTSLQGIFCFTFYDIKKYLQTSLPVILEEGLWGAGMTVVFAIYGTMGRDTLAAAGMISPFIDLSFTAFFAVSQATTTIMGNMIGRKEPKAEIKWTAWQCILLGFIASLIVMVFLSFLPYYLIPIFYPVEQEAINIARYSLWAFEALLLIRGAQMVGLIGVLRGSGDTLYGMAIDLSGVWFIMVPVVYYTAITLHWSLPFVQLSSFLFDVFVFVLVILRIRTDKWIKDITYDIY